MDGFIASTELSVWSYMEWMGRLPMILHPDPRDLLVIGFGAGRTAYAVSDEQPDRVDVVEVNPGVLELGPLFAINQGVLQNPRVRALLMDGRAWLRRSDRHYDVVTLE